MLQKIVELLSYIFDPNKQNWYNEGKKENTDDVIEKLKEKVLWYAPVSIMKVTSPYGWRKILGKRRWHSGTDYTGQNKTCFSCFDGEVVEVLKPDYEYPAKFEYKYGEWIRIDTPKGRAWTPYVIIQSTVNPKIKVKYKHVDAVVFKGEIVKGGEPVAVIANLGYSFGAHLHLEIWKKDSKWHTLNPHELLKKKLCLI